MNNKKSHRNGLQRTTPHRLGAQSSTQCTITLCVPATTFLFLFLWLRNKIHFAVDAGTQTTRVSTRVSTRYEQQNVSFERVAENNTKWVRCTSIHQVYQNIVCVLSQPAIHIFWVSPILLWDCIYIQFFSHKNSTTNYSKGAVVVV